MCRKNQLQGSCLATLGLGLLIGHSLESWFLCVCGGAVLAVLGICLFCRRI